MNDRIENQDHDTGRPGDGNGDVRAALDAEARSVEARHGDRLDAARRAALASPSAESHERSKRLSGASITALAASVTVAVLVTLVLQRGPDGPQPVPETLPQAADLELLASDEYELLSEDLEFYAWLAAQQPLEEQSG